MPAATDPIVVLNAPALPGLQFRHFRGPEDYPGMVEASMAARDAYGVEETVTVEGISAMYAHLTNSDLTRDVLVVELDGRIVGYARVQWDDQQDGARAYEHLALLRPELRGRGIGTAILGWQEGRLRAIAAGHDAGGRPRVFQAESFDRDEYQVRLLAGHGYEPVRRGYEMVRPTLHDLPAVALPAGLEIRPVGRADMRRVWEADIEAFRDHWGEIDESEEAWLRFRDEPTYDPALFVVAWDGDEIAGSVLNVIDPADEARKGVRRGVLDSVSVRRPWRRRGLARAMIAAGLHRLSELGMDSAMLGVDGENPNRAMSLYESCGFEVVNSFTVWRKPLEGDAR